MRAAGDAATNIPASRGQSDGQIKEIVANLGKATQESLRLQANLEKPEPRDYSTILFLRE